MAVCENCVIFDTASSPYIAEPATGCTTAFNQLNLKPSQAVAPYVHSGAVEQQQRPQPRFTGPQPKRHLGPTARRFYNREILRKTPYPKREQRVEYLAHPNVIQARCWAEQDRLKEAHRRTIRQAVVEDLRRKCPTPPVSRRLPNGLPWPCYDPVEFKAAYHYCAHRPQYKRASEASAEASNAYSLPYTGASIGSDASSA